MADRTDQLIAAVVRQDFQIWQTRSGAWVLTKGTVSAIESRTPRGAVEWELPVVTLHGRGPVFPDDRRRELTEENWMWTAQLTYHAPRIDLARRRAIVEMLHAKATYDEGAGRLVLTFEVDGTTARQAADRAARRGGAAVSSAARGIVPARPTRILVLPTDEFIAESEHPGALELSGVAEIAELLGVSRQRVVQLIERDGFPAPIAELASGPVFTTPSIRAFKKRWEPHRRRGRPPRARDTGAQVDHGGPPRYPPGGPAPAATQ